MRWFGIIVAALMLAACGSSGSGQESASTAAERHFGYVLKGQGGREWDELHPAQQAVVPKDAFIACRQKQSITVDSAHAIEEFDEPIDVPEVGTAVPARAVTVELKAGDKKQALTVHEINVDGHWRWILGKDEIAAYKAGTCP
jgi:hypothetical protein